MGRPFMYFSPEALAVLAELFRRGRRTAAQLHETLNQGGGAQGLASQRAVFDMLHALWMEATVHHFEDETWDLRSHVRDAMSLGASLGGTGLPPEAGPPEVCGACGKGGPDAFLGELRWARLDLSGHLDFPGGEKGLQAVLFVPLHATRLCATQEGGADALARLAAHTLTPESLTVRAVLPVPDERRPSAPVVTLRLWVLGEAVDVPGPDDRQLGAFIVAALARSGNWGRHPGGWCARGEDGCELNPLWPVQALGLKDKSQVWLATDGAGGVCAPPEGGSRGQ